MPRIGCERRTVLASAVRDDSASADPDSSLKGLSVISSNLRSFRFVLGGLLAVAMFTLLAGDASSWAEELSREQQIAELERQIQELTKKLTDLRKAEPIPPPLSDGLPDEWIKTLKWRSIGPASMGGRIGALAVYEADPAIYWIGTASGGLLKTTNNGTTFEHQFDHEATVSIGDVCVAPSDPNIVWVGTGENNPRNSVSYGDGVYKSTDGGKSWKNMGLKKSFQIGKILIHPKNPDIVYVGALGRLYGPNEERGLFKTTDGGKNWQKILFTDDKTGVIDMRMNPAEPETILVAAWERQRDGFDSHRGEPPVENGYDPYDPIKKWGPGSGIHKTTDGGKTWRKVTKGLPSSPMGRIGLDVYAKDPKVFYAIIDCREIGKGVGPVQVFLGVQGGEDAMKARLNQVTPDGPAAKAGLKAGDLITSIDKKEVKNYKELVDQIRSHKPGDKIVVVAQRDKETITVTVTLGSRPEGPVQDRPYSFWYGGQRENVQDKQGPNAHEYGGLYRSADGGESWTRINSVNPRPMYFSQVRVDPSDERHLYVLGIALYRSSDGGKSFKADGNNRVHPDQHALWIDPKDGRHMVVGTDGGSYVTYDRMNHWDFLNNQAIGQFYHVAVDNKSPYRVFGGLQDNGTWGGPSMGMTGIGPINEDWVVVSGGDGFVCRVDPQDADLVYFETQDGNTARRNLRTGERAGLRPGDQKQLTRFRFNWNTPFILSSHNPHIYYSAGNYVFRSLKQGSEARVISPEISRTKRGTATALAESPRNPDVVWAGTDDGNLWVTRDGGLKWANVAEKVGLPGPRWVSSIETSRFVDGRAYVCFDAHRSDDDEPYIYVTEDHGETWKSLRGNLPVGSSRVLREDLGNKDVLYLGTEFAVWASIDRGKTWTKLNSNLPTVAVHELAQHPSGEMVAATHGRSLWILDVTPIRQMTADSIKAAATLYQPAVATRWRREPERITLYGDGSRRFIGENPPYGAQIFYSLSKKAEKASLKIIDFSGATIRTLDVKTTPGLHVSRWDLGRNGGGLLGAAIGLLAPRAPAEGPAGPGMYKVVLTVDGKEYAQGLKLQADPTTPPGGVLAESDAEPVFSKKYNTQMDD
jgi:photosystem II stability/assembly factor-like uncharacterized protein